MNPVLKTPNQFYDSLSLWAEDEIETPYFKSIVGEVCIKSGLYERGMDLLNQAEDLMHHTGEIWYLDRLKEIKSRAVSG